MKYWYVVMGYPNRLVNPLPQWHLDLLEKYEHIQKVPIKELMNRDLEIE